MAPPHGRYHDNLWDIAERHLGDPMRWQEIFRLNDGRLMPDGQRLTRASLIRPGWVLRMPADATGLPAATVPAADPPPATPPASPAAASPAPPPRHRHAAPAPAAPQPTATARQVAPEQRRDPEPAAKPVRSSPRANPAIPVTAGLAAGAIGLLAALERRRRVASRRRQPGTRLRLPDPQLAPAEIRLRTEARDAVAVADTVRLAVALVHDKDPEPCVRAAWHHPDGAVELVLDTARAPIEPFTATERGWRLAAADRGFTLAVAGNPDPAPLLTPVGSDEAGAACYVNLEVPGLVGIDGSPADVTAMTAGIVRALAGVPWADELTQLVVPQRMSRAVVGLDRVDVLGDPPTLLDHLTRYSDRVSSSLDGEASLAAARRSGDADTVGVIVLAGLTGAELPEQLRAAAASSTAPIVAVLAGTDPHAQTWTLADGLLSIPGVADRLTPLRADDADIDATAQLLEQALDTTPAAADDPRYAAIAADCPPEPDAHELEVRVLGPVEVAGTDRVRRKPVLGLIVYLALHRRPVTSEQLTAALWPDREHNGHVLRTRISEARAALDGGIDHEGRSWKLAGSVGCDWQRFRALAAGDRADQLEALSLVRGRPFQGYDAEWLHVDGYLRAVEAAVVDLALTVAEDALADDDPATASQAAVAGLRASPYDERLYQLALSAAAARGATSEVRALRIQHERVLDEEIEPDDPTVPDDAEFYAPRGTQRRATG